MSADTAKPATVQPMTPAQRQRVSREARRKQRFNDCPAKQVSMMLSAEATQALEQLSYSRKLTQKEIIEGLLIEAYANHKRDKSSP